MNNEFGVFLEKLRGKMSLREAANKSGLSHTYIRDLELGVNRVTKTPIRPTPDTLRKLSKAYNYKFDELMRMAGFIEEVELSPEEAAQKIIGYLDAELTNDEIIEKINLRVDGIPITAEEMDEFISFVRYQRFKKKEHTAASKSEEL